MIHLKIYMIIILSRTMQNCLKDQEMNKDMVKPANTTQNMKIERKIKRLMSKKIQIKVITPIIV